MDFANKEMARLELKIFNDMQERVASGTMAVEVALEVQFKPRLAEKSRKLFEYMLPLETVAQTMVLKGDNLPATGPKQKRTDFEAEVAQDGVK